LSGVTRGLLLTVAVCAVAAGLLATALAAAPGTAEARDKDCGDFGSQAAAQRYFNAHDPRHDPDLLDGDHDGVACESNPCPCDHSGPGGGGGGGGNAGAVKRDRATVRSITDGDTIDVRLHHRNDTIRLLGIDTPEIYGGEECGGAQASRSMKHALHAGDKVRLISDPSQDNRDRYHRLLRYVERQGSDVGRRQVRHGWADVYVFNGNPFHRVETYRRAKKKARHDDIGVFAQCGGHFRG